jgi:hypothetical protein
MQPMANALVVGEAGILDGSTLFVWADATAEPGAVLCDPRVDACYPQLQRQQPSRSKHLREPGTIATQGRLFADGITQYGPDGICRDEASCRRRCGSSYSQCEVGGTTRHVYYCCNPSAKCDAVFVCGMVYNCACNSAIIDDSMCNYVVHDPQHEPVYFFSRIKGSSGCS